MPNPFITGAATTGGTAIAPTGAGTTKGTINELTIPIFVIEGKNEISVGKSIRRFGILGKVSMKVSISA